MRDAVCHIGEAVGIHIAEIPEHGVLQDFAVQLGNAVDRVRADDREVGHANLRAVDDRHPADLFPVALPEPPRLRAEALVDLVDDGVDAGQLDAEKVLVPALKRLGHHGVVGVGHRADRDVPRLFPRELMLVDQHAHQLGNHERGMRVVDVNGDLVGQVVKGFILRKMVVENILQRRTDEEILLRQP